MLSLVYGPTLTSIPDYWKNHNFEHMDLCLKTDVFVFNMFSNFVIAFLPRSKCFNFMGVVNVYSEFGAQESLPLFPLLLLLFLMK